MTISIVIKATLLLCAAAVVQGVIHRRTSAAARHLIWTLAVTGVLLLPLLSLALPGWTVIGLTPPGSSNPSPAIANGAEPASPTQPSTVAAEITAGSVTPAVAISSTPIVAGAYASGVVLMLAYVGLQRRRVRRLAYGAADLREPEWTQLLAECAHTMGVRRAVRLRRSREQSMPMALGIHQPTILIPTIADTWQENRRRAVILHELAHVARHDCLTQSLAMAACTIYWFHPAAWWIARRLRIERELACDDRVIAAGAAPRDYAGHLLEIAYSLGSQRLPALAVTMARPRQLEGRMLAVLDAARNRTVPTLPARFAVAAIATALVLPLASATSTIVAEEPAKMNMARPAITPGLLAQQQSGVQDPTQPGTWEIRPTDTEGIVHLRLMERNSSSSSNVPLQSLEGLTAAQLTGGGLVQFRVRRDAGTFLFEGVIRNRVGAGTVSFAPDANFPAELAKRGFARPTSLEQYQLARHDVGYAFIDELSKQGYAKPQTSELARAAQHGVNLAFVRDMGALGYRLGTLQPLVTLRDHGVTPTYVRELAELGYKGLPADEVRRARDHGITPEYVRELGDVGYRNLPMDQLIRVRDHGVVPEYVRTMRQLGYTVPIDDLVRARDHGIDVEFIRGMTSLGYANQPLDSLVRVRDHGVTPNYVQELKALGYDRLSLDDLVTLRDRGLTPDRIRAANARAGTRLSVDQLTSYAERGFR
jgi:beta-lactamase regulating signal transducer with metallopeptidase domain/ribosomal protein L7Ae-like RNA K-turn-binding protein